MRYERLRDMPTADELKGLYPEPHDHRRWGSGHGNRVSKTIELARSYVPLPDRPARIADLSCGNAMIAYSIARPDDITILGDYAGGYPLHGPIEETLGILKPVDVFVCCETLEHIDDPANVLLWIREKAKYLVASTPIENWGDTNGEHLHSWDREYVERMLDFAGWAIDAFDNEDARTYNEHYNYGIWVCS